MRFLKTEAIVLKSNLISEKDKIATLFTRDYGKLQAVAKGARRSKSRFVNAVRPFIVANYVIFEGQNYYYIDQWELVKNFENIEKDLKKFALASYISETISRVLEEKQKNTKLYFFTKHSLEAVESLNVETSIFLFSYTLKLISLLGYMPVLDSCAVCGKKENLSYFSSSCGGAVCKDCNETCKDAKFLNKKVLKFLLYLLKAKYEKLERISVPGVIKEEADKIITEYVRTHLEMDFKSKDFAMKLSD
ncbi:DNA repair protein RecO [Caldanaerobacter subterraneus]|uniref:DNA repair protein RecO n=3 Tax=Caldanaerobacter subterraneus TaxID=911092 RepID=RECO_CALS4|nr:DNA repair protein RecO [Caldanaerobacter subterraneus]Q8RB48.2 RecName: Full=DNA repair protein RecO; AltName: Full=Recombination protein O [Caldanaerobacter subterraneus subsp. tengcongensis MB4]NNG65967.1 DNA repair protein RecO [Caldanaerobacter subterraneus]TCO63900.1 DNA replication and repair protein RecO [Caldanaerobacter subterraneus]